MLAARTTSAAGLTQTRKHVCLHTGFGCKLGGRATRATPAFLKQSSDHFPQGLCVQHKQQQQQSRLCSPPRALLAEAMVLTFTPQHAAFGGAFIATAVIANLLLTGRVLGISGIVKGMVNGDLSNAWRPAFLVGLMGSAPYLATLFPSAFPPLPASFTVGRALLGGLLVGLGTSLGNGCTSGHGVCGNARLSFRSFCNTLSFMLAGMLSATVFNTAEAALHIAPISPQYHALTASDRGLGLALLGGAALCLSLVGLTSAALTQLSAKDADKSSSSSTKDLLQSIASAVIGATFATGLALSGMTNANKVIGFLSITKPYWDASLMFVMATAVLGSMPVFQFVMRKVQKQPACAPVLTSTFSLPNSNLIDAKLLGGGALFGLGWGLTGLCPGPALLLAASPAAGVQVWAYLVAMLTGMAAERVFQRVKAAAFA